jgi:hypothetical protein
LILNDGGNEVVEHWDGALEKLKSLDLAQDRTPVRHGGAALLAHRAPEIQQHLNEERLFVPDCTFRFAARTSQPSTKADPVQNHESD